MNPEQLLLCVEHAIATRPPSDRKTYRLVLKNRQILCVPTGSLEPIEVEFGRYPTDTLDAGLTTDEWDRLKLKISNVLRQKGLL